jgi:hypothetical protein
MVLMFISMSHVANTYPAQTNRLKRTVIWMLQLRLFIFI